MNIKRISSPLAGLCAVAAFSATLCADYPSRLQDLSPALYYRLNTTNAVPTDTTATNQGSLGAGLNATYSATARRGASGALAGNSGTAITAVSGRAVTIPWSADYNPSGAFAVEAWLKPASDAAGLTAPLNSGNMASPRTGWLLYQNGPDGWSFRMYNQNGTTVSAQLDASTPVVAGNWYHFAVSFDGSNAKLYINGTEAASANPAGTPSSYVPNLTLPMSIGTRTDDNYNWSGDVDEVAVYAAPLTAAEIKAHYDNGINASRTTAYSSLILSKSPKLYFRLEEPAQVFPSAVNSGRLGDSANGTFLLGTSSGLKGPAKPAFDGFEVENLAAGFNGASHIVIPPQAALNSVTEATYVCWVKRDGDQNARAGIFFSRNSTSLATGIGVPDSGNTLSYSWNDTANSYNWNPGFTIPDKTWTFVAVSITPENAVMYMGTKDGLKAATNNVSHEPHDFSTVDLNLGWDTYSSTRKFKGSIDEAAFFDKALTYDQIAGLFHAVQPAVFTVHKTPADPVYEGMTVTLTADISVDGAYTAQWRKDGATLAGKTGSTLAISKAVVSDSGIYDVVVTAGSTKVVGEPIALTVQVGPPIILAAPVSAVRMPNGAVTFSVSAMGSSPIEYQWKKEGALLAGATNSSFSLVDLALSDAGEYSVTVKNPFGTKEEKASLSFVSLDKMASVVTDANPIGYWKLDETSGSTASDYIGGRDGTATASGVTNGVAGPRPSAFKGFASNNTAYQFNGSSGAVAFPALNLNKNTMTIAAWIYPTAPTGIQGVFFCRGGATVAGMHLLDTNLRYHWNDQGSAHDWDSGLNVVQNQWNFVVVSIAADQATLYLDSGDGLQSAVNPVKHSAEEWNATGYIGQDSGGGRFFNGIIDEIAVFDRTLSESEIQKFRNAGFAGTYGGPVAPAITKAPAGQTILSGSNYVFSVTATGSVPMSYQWQFNGASIPGATRSVYSIPAATPGDSGNYSVIVSNSVRALTTTPVNLTVKPAPSYANFTNDLVLHLAFDGDGADTSKRGNSGTLVGEPSFVAGPVGGKAVRCSTDVNNGVYNYVTLGAPADLQFGSDVNFSVAFWARFTGSPGDLPFLCSAINSYNNAGLTFAPSYNQGGWSYYLGSIDEGASLGLYGAQNTLNDGQWHNLVFTFDRKGNAITYLDTTIVDSRSMSGTGSFDSGSAFNIGQDPTGSYGESAVIEIDDLGIWRRALNQYEAQSIYVVGKTHGRSFDLPGEEPQEPIRLTIEKSATGAKIGWSSGVLQSAPSIQGPWTPVSGAQAPSYTATFDGNAKYFRVK